MAWLAAATSNEDLCEQLAENGILTNDTIRRAFTLTDRGDFVQAQYRLVVLSHTNEMDAHYLMRRLKMLQKPSIL
jgi:protein-L-isoaspartate O-methyltransferase